MTKQLFIVNKTESHLHLMAGYFQIRQGGFAQISPSHIDHPDVLYATQRDWAFITDEKPVATEAPAGPDVISSFSPYQGMTEADLKALKPEAPKPVATATAIGRPEERVETPEQPQTDDAPKRGRGKAAEKTAE